MATNNHITEEPSVGSVVIDYEGDAWQSDPYGSGRWNIAMAESMSSDWEYLMRTYGPLTLVWSPDE